MLSEHYQRLHSKEDDDEANKVDDDDDGGEIYFVFVLINKVKLIFVCIKNSAWRHFETENWFLFIYLLFF